MGKVLVQCGASEETRAGLPAAPRSNAPPLSEAAPKAAAEGDAEAAKAEEAAADAPAAAAPAEVRRRGDLRARLTAPRCARTAGCCWPRVNRQWPGMTATAAQAKRAGFDAHHNLKCLAASAQECTLVAAVVACTAAHRPCSGSGV